MIGVINALISAQSFMNADYFMYEDQSYIDSFTVQNKIDEYIIYQTYMIGNSLGPGETTNDLVSFLVWQKKGSTSIKMITQTTVSKSVKVDSIVAFKDEFLNKLWVEKKEDVLKFVPPVVVPLNAEMILYINKKKKYFYIHGSQGYYMEELAKRKYREELVLLLKKMIIPGVKKNQIESIYKRPDLYLREE
jgi:hypothetical protein